MRLLLSRRLLCSVVFVLGFLSLPPSLAAQLQRYELGRRLRAFEAEWERTPGEASDRRCVAPLQKAVNAFFTARYSEAGRWLDEARFAISGAEPTAAQRWAKALAFCPAARLIDSNSRELPWECTAFYEVPMPPGKDFLLRVALLVGGKQVSEQIRTIGALPLRGQLDVKDALEGDHTLRYEVLFNQQTLAQGALRVSLVNELTDRVARLKREAAKGDARLATERATVQATARLLRKLQDGESVETDYAAARLLRDAESAVASIDAGKCFFTCGRSSEHRLSLVIRPKPSAPEQAISLRILVPPHWDTKNPPPVVVALHGAGGSENMFFEGYGNGKIVQLCALRGWMLVAPRFAFTLPLAALLDELHDRYPYDRTRVLVLGHSMGAAAAVQAASLDPKRYAGVAALGGSGGFKPSEELKNVPFFIAVGEQDFALAAARSLHRRLLKDGVKTVRLRELANVEHLGVVQQSLGEAFQFFDAARQRR
jgi:predicted esterase